VLYADRMIGDLYQKLIGLFHTLIQLIRDPGVAIAYGGYGALALIIFLETGAMVFFLPGIPCWSPPVSTPPRACSTSSG
jgi:hypothetical protein